MKILELMNKCTELCYKGFAECKLMARNPDKNFQLDIVKDIEIVKDGKVNLVFEKEEKKKDVSNRG